MNQSERRNFLIQSLLEESREYRGMQIPSDSTGQRQLLRGLMNVRMVKKVRCDCECGEQRDDRLLRAESPVH